MSEEYLREVMERQVQRIQKLETLLIRAYLVIHPIGAYPLIGDIEDYWERHDDAKKRA